MIKLLCRTAAAAVAGLALPAAPALAVGGSGGAAYGADPQAPAPAPARVTCRAACSGIADARTGSVVQVSGAGLQHVQAVLYMGGPGGADDVGVPVSDTSPQTVTALVPQGAASGPVAVVDAAGGVSKPTREGLAISSGRPAGDVEERLASRTVFFGGLDPAALDVYVPDATPVGVDLVRLADGATIGHWDLQGAGTVQPVTWDGTLGGRVQPDGRYAFRVAGAATRAFSFFRYRFPILGPHSYGGGAGRFGAQRDGHVHQGQDVFADCGTPLVAARGGTVVAATFQALAGNYVVIDQDATSTDAAYMHLRDPALVNVGDHVATGQPIGFVGDTGDAVGCHLHFEVHRAPGWLAGGPAFDPLRMLRAWDAQSGTEARAAAKRKARAKKRASKRRRR